MSMRVDKATAYYLAVLPVRWQVFASLTFKGTNPPGRFIRQRVYHEWVRRVAKGFSCHPGSLLWIRREELGDRTRREHYHALLFLGRLIEVTNHRALMIRQLWIEAGGGPRSIVTAFSPTASASDYLAKIGIGEGILHEERKFASWDSNLMLSNSLLAWIQRCGRNSGALAVKATASRD